jgi:hypothetical protein
VPQRVIDIIDVTSALDAFRAYPWPCANPCP